MQEEQEFTIPIASDDASGGSVSGLLVTPANARACLVLAHGAGAGMTHPFMAAVACGMAARGIACLRYQFPFMQAGSKRPDRPAVAIATVRSAVAAAVSALPGLPVFAGGKSFGGRMSSTAQATRPMPGVRGLVFLGFPLHPTGKPGTERARHLEEVRAPMLFVQGTRDTLADLALLRPVITVLEPRVTLLVVNGADHSFHVAGRRARALGRATPVTSVGGLPPSGDAVPPGRRQTDADVLAAILDDVADWMDHVAGA